MTSPRPRPSRLILVLGGLAGLVGTGCENRIGGGRVLNVDNPPVRSDAGVFLPMPDAEVVGTDAGPPPPPEDGGTVFNPFPFGTVGSRCVGADRRPFLVLSGTDADCDTHAAVLRDGANGMAVAYAPLDDLTSLGARQLQAQVCLSTAPCETRTLELNVSQIGDGQPLVATWTIQLDGVRAEGQLNAPWCDYDANQASGTFATGLTLAEVAFYQGVKVAVMQDGAAIQITNAPIVAERPALVRVFVNTSGNFQARQLVGRLHIETPGEDPLDLEEVVQVSGRSTEEVPGSTFNFQVPADVMKTGARYSVGLYEAGAQECGGGSSDPTGVLFPQTGLADVQPASSGGDINVVLVPVRYNADGSGRLPDTSAAQVDRYFNAMYGMFPVPGVNITVREPFDWNSQIARNGAGWSQILQAILGLRNDDRPPANTYYYGIFAPASSFSNYCSGGCVTGLGPVPGAGDSYSRGAVGVGFSGGASPGTFVHEIGHALGRRHAPCQVQDADPGFPYSGGRLGVWGFDLITNTLKEPNDNRDLMGYCDPAWISDYTFDAMFRRIASVNGASPLVAPVPREFKVLMDDMDGVRWGRTVIIEGMLEGQAVPVTWLGPLGEVLGTASAHGYPLDHIEGRYVLLPAPPDGATQVDVAGTGRVQF